MQPQDRINARVTNHTMVHEQMNFRADFRRDAHPMAIFDRFGRCSCHHDSTDTVPQHREIDPLTPLMPTLRGQGAPTPSAVHIKIKNNLSYARNFRHTTFATPCEEYVVNPVIERALDRIFVHADHEQNASTSTVRLCGKFWY
jgi:citrate synthase